MNKHAKKDDEIYNVGNYVVAYINLIGKREQIAELKKLPKSKNEKIEYIKSIIWVRGVLSGLDTFPDDFVNGEEEIEEDNPEAEVIRNIKNSISCPIRKQRLPDGLMLFVPLYDERKRVSAIEKIYNLLLLCASINLLSFVANCPIRGGIEIGIGCELYKNELYGPVIKDAYDLESKIAQYPRIVVGGKLEDYINRYGDYEISTIDNSYTQKCTELFRKDPDRHKILHYLGKCFRRETEGKIENKYFKEAFTFVKIKHHKYTYDGDNELAERYHRLLKYFERFMRSGI